MRLTLTEIDSREFIISVSSYLCALYTRAMGGHNMYSCIIYTVYTSIQQQPALSARSFKLPKTHSLPGNPQSQFEVKIVTTTVT